MPNHSPIASMAIPMAMAMALLMASPALIAQATPTGKAFSGSKEFQTTPKGDLLNRFGIYDRMVGGLKGSECDWVFADPGFEVEDLRKAGLTLTVAAFASHEDGGYRLGNLSENPVVGSFRQSIRALGVKVTEGEGSQSQEGTVLANARAVAAAQHQGGSLSGARTVDQHQKEAMAMMYRQNPQVLELMVDQRLASDSAGTQAEVDRYQEEKAKLGTEEAAKRAEGRKAERRARTRAEFLGDTPKAPEPTPAKTPKPPDPPKSPEDRPGYQLVAYVHESKAKNNMFTIVATNTTTAEFLLLKDGKPLLAGRHNSVGVGMTSGSGAKCGRALASAFSAKP